MYHLPSGLRRKDLSLMFVRCQSTVFAQKHMRAVTKCPRRKRNVRISRVIMHSADQQKEPVSEGLSTFPRRDSYGENARFTVPDSGPVMFMAIADEFDMPALSRRLLKCKTAYGGIETAAHGPVLRVVKPSSNGHTTAETFIFPYGCMVVWGTKVDSDDILSLVIEDALEPRGTPLVDSMEYVCGESGSLRRELITLEARPPGVSKPGAGQGPTRDELAPSLERLAISWGLAQSIKLGAFESAMRTTIENTRHLPEELAHSGQITASKREVSRLMGRLFLDRYCYHLSGDLLITPAFFGEHEQYLPCYRRVERYLEISERGEVLNKRVEVVQELYHLLGDELSHQNSIALELAITVMIAFEILLTLITLAKESVRSVFSACALFFCLIALGWTLWILYRRRRFSKSVSRFPRPRNEHK